MLILRCERVLNNQMVDCFHLNADIVNNFVNVNTCNNTIWNTSQTLLTNLNLPAFTLIYKGSFNGDFNNNPSTGIYRLEDPDSYTNGPKNKPGYGLFIQFNEYRTQIIICSYAIYSRRYAGNPAVWETWYKYNGTEN